MIVATAEERIRQALSARPGRQQLVAFVNHRNAQRLALASVSACGEVQAMMAPRQEDMYITPAKVCGDTWGPFTGGVVVWGYRDSEVMAAFVGPPERAIYIGAPRPERPRDPLAQGRKPERNP